MSISGGPTETTTLIRLDGTVIGNPPPELEIARARAAAPRLKAVAVKSDRSCLVCLQKQAVPILMLRMRGSEVLDRFWIHLCTWDDLRVTPEQVQLLPRLLELRAELQRRIDDWHAAGPQDVI